MSSIANICAGKEKAFYVYDINAFNQRLKDFTASLPKNCHSHYAMKANANAAVLKCVKDNGYGVDVVSGGELQRALDLGFLPEQIVFSGVGKTHAELSLAMTKAVLQIHVESEPELRRIQALAKKLSVRPRVAFRVNPDVNPKTHPYITTGFRENKFGMEFSVVKELLADTKLAKEVEITGLTLHIGSQILAPDVFREAIQKTLRFYQLYPGRFEMLDIGGGLGIDYHSQDHSKDLERLKAYSEIVSSELGDFPKILLEPGRFLIGRFGKLVTPVEYVKRTQHKNFVIVQAGMHQLMRPALYQAYHHISPVIESNASGEVFDVVGPICESTDVLGRDRQLPSDIKEGDWLMIHDTGAYGYVMANQYNLHEMPEEMIL